ncbi:MAG: hypothetical protein ACK4R6_06455 [Spirosomataceae bacterium]
MLSLLDWLINRFEGNRKAFAVSFFFFGTPVIYFLRDGVGLAPNSTVFTAAFTFGSLLLAVPFRNSGRFYSFNKPIFSFIIIYWIIALIYLAVYAPNRGWFTNTTVEFVYFLVLVVCAYIFAASPSSDFLAGLLTATLWICLIGSVAMVIIVLKDPTYVLGNRAAISFGVDKDGVSIGNPHIYGRSAFAGFVASILVRTMSKNPISRLFYLGCSFIFLLVIVLTQSFQTIIALLLFGVIFMYVRTTATNVYFLLKWIFGWRGFLTFLFLACIVYYYLTYTDILNRINHFYMIIGSRFEKVFSFLSFEEINPFLTPVKEITTDASALGRVETIGKVGEKIIEHIENKEWWWLLLGNGYHSLYVDSPMIQTFHDLGIIGFFSYLGMHIYILKYALSEYKKSAHPALLFLCLFIIHTFVQNFVYGMPYDYTRWSFFIFMARILKDYRPLSIPPVVPSPKV